MCRPDRQSDAVVGFLFVCLFVVILSRVHTIRGKCNLKTACVTGGMDRNVDVCVCILYGVYQAYTHICHIQTSSLHVVCDLCYI